MTLDEVALKVPVRIVGFTVLDESQRAQLSGLGLRAGATVTKLMFTPLRDPVECLVGPQLLALERRLLGLIRVEAV
ncbi:MAG: ferrous iron transport protein A [Elusimicrobiota bacterium]